MYFIWLPSPELAIQRIAKRVREGGHNIPDAVVRRRYARGLTNLFDLYIPIVTTVCVYDGASFLPIPMAEIEGEKKLVLDYTGASNEHGSILRWLIFSLLHAPLMQSDSV
jgi:predicted ABC-type ATPase